MNGTAGKPAHFVAFGKEPGLPGRYDRKGVAPSEIRAFCKNGGEGFWSLVVGAHPALVCTETLKASVPDSARFGSKNQPEIRAGDLVLVVVPPEGFEIWTDKRMDDWSFEVADPNPIPVPKCDFEIWTRLA